MTSSGKGRECGLAGRALVLSNDGGVVSYLKVAGSYFGLSWYDMHACAISSSLRTVETCFEINMILFVTKKFE